MSMSLQSRDRLTVLNEFGTDPGSLSSNTYIPKKFSEERTACRRAARQHPNCREL